MNKRSKKAIAVFKNYSTELEQISNLEQANNWRSKVHDSLILYLGNDSALTKRFGLLSFSNTVNKHSSQNFWGEISEFIYDDKNKDNYELLLETVINHIEQNGVIQDFIKTNFLSQFSTTQLIAGLVSIISLSSTIGWYCSGPLINWTEILLNT